jgi:hypothetical protein
MRYEVNAQIYCDYRELDYGQMRWFTPKKIITWTVEDTIEAAERMVAQLKDNPVFLRAWIDERE